MVLGIRNYDDGASNLAYRGERLKADHPIIEILELSDWFSGARTRLRSFPDSCEAGI
jgi:hypothetical protein